MRFGVFIVTDLQESYFLISGPRLHDFKVGVTDVSPLLSPPNTTSSQLCGTYTGDVLSGTYANVSCTPNTNLGRYVIIQMPGTNETLCMCEVEVYVWNTGGNSLSGVISSYLMSGVISSFISTSGIPEVILMSGVRTIGVNISLQCNFLTILYITNDYVSEIFGWMLT